MQPQYVYIHVHHTHLYNWSTPSCYSIAAAFNGSYSELTPYTAIANSYWVSFYDVYQCQGHAHYWYWLQLLFNSCRICFNQQYGVNITPHNAHWTKNQISCCLYPQETWMTHRPKFPFRVSCMTMVFHSCFLCRTCSSLYRLIITVD